MFGSPSENWSEFLNWVTSIKINDISFDVDYATDSIAIRNRTTNESKIVSRMTIEYLEPAFRRQAIIETIAQMLPTTGSVHTSALGGAGQYSVSSGGAGGIGMRGAMGAPAYVDEYYTEQAQKDVLAKKLFSDDEQLQIMEVKKSIRSYIHKHMPTYDFDMSGVVVAGGCFASMMNDEVVKDFDIFLLNNSRNELALNLLTVKESALSPTSTKINDKEYFKNDKIEKTVSLGRTALQYIYTKYNTRKELIDSFDFKHCCVSYDYANDKMFMSREVFNLIKSKTLRPNSDKAIELWRYEKFWQRGWKSEIAFI